MAAKKKQPARKSVKKGIRSRMPTKRSINLILIDENKVSLPKAILGIIVIVALAAVFSKFMVIDRLQEMSEASGRVAGIKGDIAAAESQLSQYGDVESVYAHYTLADMTPQELGMVDRVRVLELVGTILPAGETALNPREFEARVVDLIRETHRGSESVPDREAFSRELRELMLRVVPTGYTVNSWNVGNNLLTVSIKGTSLERLNRLARQLERESIVNTCAITTASKSEQKADSEVVQGQFVVYLQQPVDEPEGETVAQ